MTTHRPTETTDRYLDCLGLFLKQNGKNIARIEREMRRLGHHDFTRRILYARTEKTIRKPGWIERYAWKQMLDGQTGRNTTGRECAPLPARPRNGHRETPLLDRRGGGVFADGVVDPTRSGSEPNRNSKVDQIRSSTTPPSGHPSYPGGEFKSPHSSHKSSPPSQGGVAASSADGVGTPGSLPSGRSCKTKQHSGPDHAARVSGLLADTPRHTAPRRRPIAFREFQEWLERVSPNMTWDWAHQLYIYSKLKKITDGSCKRLMIFLPPRHGKSELVTVRYTAWRIAQDPSMNVILGSYNQRLADRFSRKVRRVLADDASITLKEKAQSAGFSPSAGEATAAAPGEQLHRESTHTAKHRSHANPCSCPTERRAEARTLNAFTQRQANSVSEWETAQGGTFRAVGVGAGVTGFGASLIVVDDPVKSRAEAESETYRDKVYEWFNDDLYTRLEPDGAIILIQTRWHEDDLAGRLLKEMAEGGEHWDVVNLPALCEEADIQHSPQSSPPYEGGVAASSPTGWFSRPQSEGNIHPKPHNATQRSTEGGFIPAPSSLPFSSSPRLRVSAVQPAHEHLERVPSLQPAYDPIGRLPGEALCPPRFDEAALEKLRRKLGSYSFSALYQQRPVPAEGGLFKRKWFKTIVDAPPPNLKWKRGYDLAVSTRTTACYTASAKCAFDKDGNLYIADVMRKRMEFPEQRRYIFERIVTERSTEHGIELAIHGHALMQDLRRQAQLRGTSFKGIKVDADKVTRSLSWANLAEEGKVILVRGPWIPDFLDEVTRFPSGATDDQIDAVSLAVKMCKERRSVLYTF